MSKTIRKIPWAVPGLAAVALAAFLAIGLLATHGVQPVAAQDSADCTVDATSATDIPDEACSVTGSAATVEFTGPTGAPLVTDTPRVLHLFIEDESGGLKVYPAGAAWDTTDERFEVSGNEVKLLSLRYEKIEVPLAEFNESTAAYEAQSITITVTGDVRIFDAVPPGGSFTEDTTGTGRPEDTKRIKAVGTRGGIVTITFLGAPALMDADDVVRSQLTELTIVDGVVPIGANDDITVTATVQDADGNSLEGQISYSVDYVDGSALKDGRVDYTTQVMDYVDAALDADDKGLEHVVSGWQAEGAVRVIVSARFVGGTGNLDLTPIQLTRTGAAATLSASTYSCEADTDNTEADNGCADDFASVADMVFKPGDSFVILGTFRDTLGSEVTVAAPDIEASDTEALTKGSLAAIDGELATYVVEDDADFGTYTIAVSTGSDDDKVEQVLNVIVSGPPENYVLTGEPYIPLAAFSSEEYTVTVTDANGNPPTGDNEVNIVVQGVGATDVIDGGVQMLGDDGIVTFSIRVPFDAMRGDTANIGILVNNEVKAQMVITFGAANQVPMAGAAIGAQTVIVGAMVTVASTITDADGDMLTYSASSSDDTIATASVADNGMVTITGVAAGSATITVMAEDGYGGSASQTIPVMVEVPPNQAPMAGAAFAAPTVIVGATVTVASDITDADGDTLTYSASSSDDTIATAIVANDGMVTITGVAAGSATITVMATDPDGASASQTIAVMVNVPPNQAPMAGAAIDAQTVIVGAMVMVASDITDADGDMLTYSASSSDDAIATASVADDGMVTITGVAAGSATITVMATDPDGASASQTIAVMVEAFVAPVLGDASGLMAAAGADAGTVELTWTPGPNATRHFVAGVKQSDLDAGTPGDSLIWTFADNPDSHTVTGLDSGEVYLFVVIAGDDDGWGDWTALEMVTPS